MRVLRRHARNEHGMPGMQDLLAWACRLCRQALARDSRREGGMPRIVSAGAAVCPHSSPVLPAWHLHMPGETRGPHLDPAPPQEFLPPACRPPCRAHQSAANVLRLNSTSVFGLHAVESAGVLRIYCRMVSVDQGMSLSQYQYPASML